MRLTQEVIEKIQLAMTHTKMNGETNWKDGDEIDVCLGGTFAGDKFISIINRTRSNTTRDEKTTNSSNRCNNATPYWCISIFY